MVSRVALALLSLTVASPAAAQDPGVAAGRTLNGHTFMPSATVPGALVTTSFASYMVLGLGATEAEFQVGDRTFSGNVEYAGIGGTLAFEYAFLPWLSGRFGILESMYSGIDGKSVITVGTTLQTSAKLGLTAARPVGETLQVGFLLDAGMAPGLALTIGKGLEDLIDRCNLGDCNVGDTDTLLELNNARTVQPAVAASWAPTPALGITGNVAYLWLSQKQNDDTFTGQALVLSAAADLDLRKVWNVPLGLQLAVSWLEPVSGDDVVQEVVDLGGGVFYTGREHLALGVQFVQRRFAVVPEFVRSSWTTTLASIGLRYYW